MKLFGKGDSPKKAKKISSETDARLKTSFVRENGKKSISTERFEKEPKFWSGKKISGSENVNYKPKKGQESKTIKTYSSGKLISKQKQGTDIFGRPFTKEKEYKANKIIESGKTKKVLTKSGVKEKYKPASSNPLSLYIR